MKQGMEVRQEQKIGLTEKNEKYILKIECCVYANTGDKWGKLEENMVDTKKIINQMQQEGITRAMLAEELGMNVLTLDRKIHNEEGEILTVREVNRMAVLLSIPKEMLSGIFFD